MGDREFEPVTGDPGLVSTKARHYAHIAGAIKRSVTTLDALRDIEGMQSKAISAIREKAGEVSEDINKAQARYSVTADALVTYAAALREAQDAGNLAITHIGDKQDGVDAARTTETKADEQADVAGDDQAANQTAATAAHQATAAAGRGLDAAHAEWHEAVDMKNIAAGIAVTAIVEVVEGAAGKDLNDGWWDNWGATFADILKVVCKWAGVLAIFFAWVPVLGQILVLLAVVGAVIDLIEASIKYANGEGSVGDILLAAGGAVLSIFGGKIFAMAATKLKAVAVVKSGVTEAGQLARLQGVGRHSKEFMSAAKAAEGVAKPLSSAFKAPFVRSESAKAAYTAFKEGTKSAPELLKAAAKEAFPALDLSLRKGLGINDDLVSFYKMARTSPSLVSLPMAAGGAALTVYQGYAISEAVTNISAPDFMPGDYGKVASTVGATRDVFNNIQHVRNGDLPK